MKRVKEENGAYCQDVKCLLGLQLDVSIKGFLVNTDNVPPQVIQEIINIELLIRLRPILVRLVSSRGLSLYRTHLVSLLEILELFQGLIDLVIQLISILLVQVNLAT